MDEEGVLRIPSAREMKDVDADCNYGPDKNSEKLIYGAGERVFDVREGYDNTDEYDGAQAGCVRFSERDGSIERQQHTGGHQRIYEERAIAHAWNQEQQEEKKSPECPNQCSRETVEGIFSGIPDIRLHADNCCDYCFCRHILTVISTQIVEDKADEHRDCCFQHTLADARQPPSNDIVNHEISP